ncbi:hypothetical protein CVT25_003682 [Psilocybe cyanescens]|uniref:Uncharacterized protein n=1 Tax=Psilocybe cyanescens TaxID=93625 RepID=A0A409WP47_PSICY|nr:hypothetical protein CVT25_003682 [Psilocybe cyanescens]
MDNLYRKSPLFLGLLITIPLVAAQNLRTTTLFPLPSIPTVSAIAIQPVQSTQSFQPPQSIQPSQPIALNTLVAAPSGFPSPLPDGVARTASGKPIPCSPKNVKLNPSTHKLISECVETSFCAAPPGSPVNATGLGVCFPRLCRRDEYPFGYGTYGGGQGRRKNATQIPIPPMCPKGTFCPDTGSGCRLEVEIGGTCELARDEQCMTPPPNPNISAKENKAICLNTVCMVATQPLSARCTIENTTYVSDLNKGAAGGGQFISYVIKHDCLAPNLFCDPTGSTDGPICQKMKNLREKCRFDGECRSNNCAEMSNTCTLAPETTFQLAPWQWLATIMSIILLLASASLVLAFFHRRRRYVRYHELQEYYYEQMSLRRSILALHAAAAAEKNLGAKGPTKRAWPTLR